MGASCSSRVPNQRRRKEKEGPGPRPGLIPGSIPNLGSDWASMRYFCRWESQALERGGPIPSPFPRIWDEAERLGNPFAGDSVVARGLGGTALRSANPTRRSRSWENRRDALGETQPSSPICEFAQLGKHPRVRFLLAHEVTTLAQQQPHFGPPPFPRGDQPLKCQALWWKRQVGAAVALLPQQLPHPRPGRRDPL